MPASDPTADRVLGPPGPESESGDACGILLTRIQQGDEAAFEELYRRQGPILLTAILRIVKNRSLAEEVLQDVFAEAWTRCSSFDPTVGTGRAWLTTMCRRRSIDRVRAVQAQQDRDFSEGVKEIHGYAADVQGEALDHVEAARVTTALGQLPQEQSQAIALAYYGDLAHSQIAARLDVPLGTVKSRIRDGMARLRTHLGVADER